MPSFTYFLFEREIFRGFSGCLQFQLRRFPCWAGEEERTGKPALSPFDCTCTEWGGVTWQGLLLVTPRALPPVLLRLSPLCGSSSLRELAPMLPDFSFPWPTVPGLLCRCCFVKINHFALTSPSAFLPILFASVEGGLKPHPELGSDMLIQWRLAPQHPCSLQKHGCRSIQTLAGIHRNIKGRTIPQTWMNRGTTELSLKASPLILGALHRTKANEA